jgi:WD40 repeat protein/serine/threonine protein kinase/Flp pilus assembly protein TadD
MSEQSLFIAALERDPSERGAFLESACAGNANLRGRVEKLLLAHEHAAKFMEAPAAPHADTIDEPVTELPGTMIGPYKLLQQIGEGGMGTVYMAEQTHPVQRKVALKVIKPGMDSRQVLARFEAERQALALMDHPNIAKVHDGGTTDTGRPYFVMELVKGVPITKYCDDHHLTPRDRLELFVPVCQAVQHAHQKGIIHRDLKPSNVMVCLYDGKPVPKVIDFGVAKATGPKLTERTMYTEFGQVVGTLEYMSPEQAELNQLDIDTRSDIYSLGVLLYELLTGTTPLNRKQMKEKAIFDLLRMIREEEPPKPSTRLSTTEELPSIAAKRGLEPKKLSGLVRGELDWIVMKCLEKDRNRRYETANGLAGDIERYLHDEAVQACPPSVGYRLRKFVRRNKVALAMASALVGALVVAVVGLSVSNLLVARERDQKTQALTDKEQALANESAALTKAREQETRANERAEEAKKQQTIAKEQEVLARRRFYASQINLAQQAWEAEQPARTLELLESQRPKIDQEDLRGFDWYYLWRLCHRNLQRTLTGPNGEAVWALAITPDGKTVVSGYADGSVRVWDVATEKERAVLTGHNSLIWRLAISPNGKMVASGSMDTTVKLWDLATSELLATLKGRSQMARSVAFSPDGKTLAVGTEDCALELWDVRARKRRLTLAAHGAPTVALAYSPDGKMVATGAGWDTSRGPGGVKVWDVTLEAPGIVFQAPHGVFVTFSPDSKLLATCWHGVKVWSVPSGVLKATSEPPGSPLESVAFSPDGHTLALGCSDRTVKLWDFASGTIRTIGVHLGAVNAAAFFPQGDLLASGSYDGTLKLWHTSPAQDAASFVHKSAIRSLTFTPDSKLLLVGSDHPTTVLNAATGKETTTLPACGVVAASADANLLAAWAPDDKRAIWDVAAARARAVLPVGPKLTGAAFSRDGKTLVTWIWDSEVPEDAVRLWELATSTSRVRLRLTENIACAAFSPDGRTLATGQKYGAVTQWDATTGQQRMTLQQYESPTRRATAVAFSVGGKMLAAGNNQGMLRLWNAETGQLKVSFKGHTDAIVSVAFSPDDKTLLSGSTDRTARLWDVVTGQELLALNGHKFPVHLVAFAPDGKRLATANNDEVKLWLAATQTEAAAFRVELDPDDPDSPRASNNWGDRLQEIHRPEEAENAYPKAMPRLEKLAAAFPDTPDYRLELAYCLVASRLITDATPAAAQSQRRFAEIWRTVPVDRRFRLADRLLDYGKTLRRAGHFQEALSVMSKAIEVNPEHDMAYHHRGHTYEELKEWDRALADFAKAIQICPTDSRHYLCRARSFENLGRLYTNIRQPKEAEKAFRQAIALAEQLDSDFPNQGYVGWMANEYRLLAMLLSANGRPEEADKAYRKLLELAPQSAADHNNLAWLLATCPDAKFRDPKRAVELAKKAVELAPKEGNHLNTLGAANYRAGDWKAAIAALEKSMERRKGGDSFDWFFLAMSHWKLGQKNQAREWYDKAVLWMEKNQPKNDELHRFRAEAAEVLGVK